MGGIADKYTNWELVSIAFKSTLCKGSIPAAYFLYIVGKRLYKLKIKNMFEKITVQKEGKQVDIQDLNQSDYENFLAFINKLSIAYKIAIEKRE